MHPEKSKTLFGGIRARMGEAGERIRKIDEKVLQNPAGILRPLPPPLPRALLAVETKTSATDKEQKRERGSGELLS